MSHDRAGVEAAAAEGGCAPVARARTACAALAQVFAHRPSEAEAPGRLQTLSLLFLGPQARLAGGTDARSALDKGLRVEFPDSARGSCCAVTVAPILQIEKLRLGRGPERPRSAGR